MTCTSYTIYIYITARYTSINFLLLLYMCVYLFSESGSISLVDQVRLSSLGGTLTSVAIEIAARTGNVEILRNYFTQHPGEVHCSCRVY